MELGERIRQKRIQMGLSQEELGKRIGYTSRSSVNKIESDAQGLPLSKLTLIAHALNTTPEYLVGWEVQKPHYNTYLGSIVDTELSDIALTEEQIGQLIEYARFLARNNK